MDLQGVGSGRGGPEESVVGVHGEGVAGLYGGPRGWRTGGTSGGESGRPAGASRPSLPRVVGIPRPRSGEAGRAIPVCRSSSWGSRGGPSSGRLGLPSRPNSWPNLSSNPTRDSLYQLQSITTWEAIPEAYRGFGVADASVFPQPTHRSVDKKSGQRAPIERWHNTVRQRLARYVRKTLSFSRSLAFHEGVTRGFVPDSNLGLLPSVTS